MMDTSGHTNDLQQQVLYSSSSSSSSSSASLAMITPHATAISQRPIPAARIIATDESNISILSSAAATTTNTPYLIPSTTTVSNTITHGFHPSMPHSLPHTHHQQHQKHQQLATDMANYSLENSFVLSNGAPVSTSLSPMSQGVPSATLPMNLMGGQQRPLNMVGSASHPIAAAYPYSTASSPSSAYGGVPVVVPPHLPTEPFASHPPLYRPSSSSLPIVAESKQQQRYYDGPSAYPLAQATTAIGTAVPVATPGIVEPALIVGPSLASTGTAANSWVSPLMNPGPSSSHHNYGVYRYPHVPPPSSIPASNWPVSNGSTGPSQAIVPAAHLPPGGHHGRQRADSIRSLNSGYEYVQPNPVGMDPRLLGSQGLLMVTEPPLLHRIPGSALVPTPVPVIGHPGVGVGGGGAYLPTTVALGLDPTAFLAHSPLYGVGVGSAPRPVVMPPLIANGLPGAHLPPYWPPQQQQLQPASLTSYLPVTTTLVAPLSVMSSSHPLVPAVPLLSSTLPLASTVPLIPRSLSTLAPTPGSLYASVNPSGHSTTGGGMGGLPIVGGKIPLPPAPNTSLTRAPMSSSSLNNTGSSKKKSGDVSVAITEVPEDEPKKYVCRFCSKRFSRPSSLNTHTYTHTGERPFPCTLPNCGRSFSVLSNLRRHIPVCTKNQKKRANFIKYLEETTSNHSSESASVGKESSPLTASVGTEDEQIVMDTEMGLMSQEFLPSSVTADVNRTDSNAASNDSSLNGGSISFTQPHTLPTTTSSKRDSFDTQHSLSQNGGSSSESRGSDSGGDDKDRYKKSSRTSDDSGLGTGNGSNSSGECCAVTEGRDSMLDHAKYNADKKAHRLEVNGVAEPSDETGFGNEEEEEEMEKEPETITVRA